MIDHRLSPYINVSQFFFRGFTDDVCFNVKFKDNGMSSRFKIIKGALWLVELGRFGLR